MDNNSSKGSIRKARASDYDTLWEIFQAVIQTEDTYVFPKNTSKEALTEHWLAPYMHTYVYEDAGQVLGTYIIKSNQTGLGDHVANASYMVHPKASGKGIGSALCAHSLTQAKTLGFTTMQFNLVVETNTRAIALWQRFGFTIMATIPKAFRHAQLGLVGAHIIYRPL
ncbi:GNAT family N-acetyltransferase [Sediminicola luteus]|uniref:GNAT family N-acetyltransferase n=1 Tax=Sediminicola luteus TaxID=319238 RepID=A0A2A4GF84_9FLAO|nr:GNAT family N-acetyltransferase [Sediminicola luteus]PCE66684.1 GNAT family N-acetyltransferase [Sediminicola luteus]